MAKILDRILIVDFGSQTTQLLGRRIREIGILSEIVPHTYSFTPDNLEGVKGVILSGSPHSVYEEEAPAIDSKLYESGLPVLGICYGLQRLIYDHKGAVSRRPEREYGRSRVTIKQKNKFLTDLPDNFVSWMSHGDSIEKVPEGISVLAESENNLPAVVAWDDNHYYGLQFHPEVTHCEYGKEILENFASVICGAKQEWSLKSYIDQIYREIRTQVQEKKVLLLISGGVDSTVVAGLLLHALDPEQVHLMYIDTGLMRKNETAGVAENLKQLGAKHLHIINAEKDFLEALNGVSDPEEKRRIIGDLFITVQEREIEKHNVRGAFLAQGTLYTDLIESGKGVGKSAKKIKSHHNVGSPLVEEKRNNGMLVEPLHFLYKDEVREIGTIIGINPEIVHRHPFPGPGLAVRILGEITKERCDVLREADAIFIEELKSRDLYDKIWQAFSVLLPVRSVGVTGDYRNYGFVLSLRAVVSRDGMTADVYEFNVKDLMEISSRITNSVQEIGRVVYDISSKPPSTIEWE